MEECLIDLTFPRPKDDDLSWTVKDRATGKWVESKKLPYITDIDERSAHRNKASNKASNEALNDAINTEMSKLASGSMSELEKRRMQIIWHYLDANKEISSSTATKLLEVEAKTARRSLSKAERLNLLKGVGKTKKKVYFRE